MNIDTLNAQFGLDRELSFKQGPGDLVMADINNQQATATVALQGAHIVSYQPHGQQPVLWVSKHSHYRPGKAIRGGIPICWPWFADHPTDSSKPAHGVARTTIWQVAGAKSNSDGTTRLSLTLRDTETTRALWPHAFQLRLNITVGPALVVELVVHNSGDETFVYSGAMHSYFSVCNIADVSISGLGGGVYLDKVHDYQQGTQQGPITIFGETDRIYLNTSAECRIEDRGWQRQIVVSKQHSRTTVVWNPWRDKARQMSDFGDDEYRGMVCVETANAGEDVISVAPGRTTRLQTTITLA